MTLPSEPLRLNQIGPGVRRDLDAGPDAREAVRRDLGLGAVRSLSAEVSVAPAGEGWRLAGRLRADIDQTCGVTLEPLPTAIDAPFAIDLVEGEPPESEGEVDLDVESDAPDRVTGQIDLWAYVIEQLALALDPFPRKPGAVFVQPDEPQEASPFAVLTRLTPRPDGKS
jgi:uncharacterized metal-binding protein YceD (DUF177 family)